MIYRLEIRRGGWDSGSKDNILSMEKHMEKTMKNDMETELMQGPGAFGARYLHSTSVIHLTSCGGL